MKSLRDTEPVGLMVELQHVAQDTHAPSQQDFQHWLDAGFPKLENLSVLIRIVDPAESRQLNREYRGKDKSTNVLSFPFEVPAGVPNEHLGDLVICAEVVNSEAKEQGKTASAHWAHIAIHGVLHLMGYDHIDPDEAEEMEAIEVRLLNQLEISNPYL